jgi:hypothetical protein
MDADHSPSRTVGIRCGVSDERADAKRDRRIDEGEAKGVAESEPPSTAADSSDVDGEFGQRGAKETDRILGQNDEVDEKDHHDNSADRNQL